MLKDPTIQNELIELNSMLAGVSNTNIYTVPDGYFDMLSNDILSVVQQKPITLLEKSTVPEGYFEGLAGEIMGKIKAGMVVEDERSALLDGLKHINVYQVPLGYFDNLAAVILNNLPQPAKVVAMKQRSSFFKYAAAAVITGILGLSIISLLDKTENGDETMQPFTVMAQANVILKTNSFDQVLSTVSDDDIVNYLQNNGEDVNAALVASVTDDKNLPDEVEYLTDDQTLNNLLNELKVNESTKN